MTCQKHKGQTRSRPWSARVWELGEVGQRHLEFMIEFRGVGRLLAATAGLKKGSTGDTGERVSRHAWAAWGEAEGTERKASAGVGREAGLGLRRGLRGWGPGKQWCGGRQGQEGDELGLEKCHLHGSERHRKETV